MDDRLAPVIGIVGSGVSGTLTAIDLLRRARGPLRITLVERTGDFGPNQHLRELLEREQARAFPVVRVRRVHGRVTEVRQSRCCVELSLAAGERLRCDRAVLAVGSSDAGSLQEIRERASSLADELCASLDVQTAEPQRVRVLA